MNNIDWASLINRGFESKDLDYKGPLEWDPGKDKKSCCELVKDILAIANIGGGWLITGLKETEKGYTPVGVSDQQAGSFESTSLNQFVNKYADPPVNALVHKPHVDGKVFIAIQIQGFHDTPHICQKDYPGVLHGATLYIRTDNNESAPIKSSSDFRGIIERTTRNRADKIVSSVRDILIHGSIREVANSKEQFEKQIQESEKKCDSINLFLSKGYGYRETAFFIESFEQHRFDMTTLRKMAENASVDLRGWTFIFYHKSRTDYTYAFEEGLETKIVEPHYSTRGDNIHFWRLYESGLLFTKEILMEDKFAALGKGTDYIDFDKVSLLAGETVNCLVRLYEGLIEDFLPIQAISAEASREKSVRKGHISTLHLWWARRPLVACRAAVYGALVPASQFVPENGPDNKKQTLGRANAAKFVTELCKYP
jgi:hypothetical protein